MSREFGKGFRYSGEQQLFPIVSSAAADAKIFGTGTATLVDGNQMDLSPDSLNGRLALIACGYDRYRFTHVDFIYTPTVATSTSDGMVLAFIQDASFTGTMNYVTAQEVTPSVTTPFRERCVLSYNYTGDQCWYSKLDVSTASLARQTVQGMLFGYRSANSGGLLPEGNLRLRYTIELYQQAPTLGLVLTGLSALEYAELKGHLDALRTKKEVAVERKDFAPVPLARPVVATGSMSALAATGQSTGAIASHVDDRYILVKQP